jgi:predicted TIM-barrel fold metal-dependent hydrolase
MASADEGDDGARFDRRAFLNILGGFSASAVLTSYGIPVAGRPSGLALEIDAHCHAFNGRDMPVYGFLRSVVLEQLGLLGIVAEPLAILLALIIEGNAPDYAKEHAILQRLVHNPAGASRFKRNSDRSEQLIAEGLRKFRDRYTSFGRRRKVSGTEENDEMIRLLMQRFGPAGFRPKKLSKQQLHDLLSRDSFADDLVKEMVRQQRTQAKGFSEYWDRIVQFLRWAPMFTDYRFQILQDDLAGRFGDPSTTLRVRTPAIVDLDLWLHRKEFPDQVTPVDQQADLIELISRAQLSGLAVHGLVAFDPWRYLADPNALKVVKFAIEHRGFLGVKVYPPMGFRASGNAALPDSAFPQELVKLCGGQVGQRIDAALQKLYAFCNKNHLAIMAHCAETIGAGPGYAKRAAPEFWTPVLEQYPQMRVNLGHFGGIWDFYPDSNGKLRTHWPAQIAKLMLHYKNLYVDIGDFSGVLERWPKETRSTKAIFANLKVILKHEELRSRIMFGTDWLMLGREPRNEHYYQAMRKKFSQVLNESDVEGFLGKNAARFFGLNHGTPTRKRLDAFYRRHSKPPVDFDTYLAS